MISIFYVVDCFERNVEFYTKSVIDLRKTWKNAYSFNSSRYNSYFKNFAFEIQLDFTWFLLNCLNIYQINELTIQTRVKRVFLV